MKVKNIMTKDIISFKPRDPISYVAYTLHENHISGAPVVYYRKVVGIVSETDILLYLEKKELWINLFAPKPHEIISLVENTKKRLSEVTDHIQKTIKTPVENIMTKKVVTVSDEDPISHVSKLMRRNKINRVPVVNHRGELIGIVTRGDILSALI
jgi:CBS domain-containing protein